MYGSIINLCGVIGFALCMIIGNDFGSFIASMFIAFGFVPMMCAFCAYQKENAKAAGYSAIIFSAMYSVTIL
jgi:multidrug efflux pump subunit AcrB